MSPVRNPARPVKATNTVELLKRITVLNLIRDAFQVGIQVRSIPNSPQKCTRIVKEILQVLRPNFHCVPRYYCVAKTKEHRLKIGDYQVTLCPWAVEIIPLTNEDHKVPVITEASKILPYEMGSDYHARILRGPVGAYASANGFDLMYMTQRSGNIIIWAGSEAVLLRNSRPRYSLRTPGPDNTKNEVKTLMRNVVSPLTFCRCIAYIYDELKESGTILGEAQYNYRNIQKTLGELYKQKKPIKPKEILATPTGVIKAMPVNQKGDGMIEAMLVKSKPTAIIAKKIVKKPEDHDEISEELRKIMREMLS